MMVKKPKIERVRWVDSYGCGASWQERRDVKPVVQHCESVGFVVRETKKYIVIAGHYAEETKRTHEQLCGEMTIPKIAIVKRERLR